MFRSILLPLDGSAFAEHAIPYAIDIARRAAAVLHTVRVYVPDESWRNLESITPYRFEHEIAAEPRYEREERGDERDYLDAVMRVARKHGVRTESAVLDGHVTEALEDYAVRVDADLVVMASHGRGPLDRAWIGSVADRMLRQQTTPMLVVRPSHAAPPRPDWTPPLEHVLIPLDGSNLSERILEPATELGRLRHARCTLLTAMPPAGVLSVKHAAAGAADRELTGSDGMRAYLERVAKRLRDAWSDVYVEVLEEPDAVTAVLETAARLDVDLIALSTHGRGGVARLLLGSVADKVIRGASVPVLAWRPEVPMS